MLNFGITGLTIAFFGVVALILSLHLYSRWPPLIKALATLAGVFLCAVTYSSYPGLLGWPAEEKVLPSRLFLLAIQIEEPRRIYLWGRDMDAGLGKDRPRAYEIPYTVKLHQEVERAGSKLKRGLPVIAQRRASEGPRLRSDEASEIERGPLIEFVEAPEGLIPDKE